MAGVVPSGGSNSIPSALDSQFLRDGKYEAKWAWSRRACMSLGRIAFIDEILESKDDGGSFRVTGRLEKYDAER
eukprot:297822-Amorphochlora_amoeboformis.AAC.1